MTLAPDKMDAIVKALWHIHEHPEDWNQAEWVTFTFAGACGTVACLAGRIALQCPDMEFLARHRRTVIVPATMVRYDGEILDISDAVASFLLKGATARIADAHQVHAMFAGANTQDELWYLASELTDDPLTPPPGVSLAAGQASYDRVDE